MRAAARCGCGPGYRPEIRPEARREGQLVRPQRPTHASRADGQTALLLAGGFAGLLLVDEPVHDWLSAHPGSPVHAVLGVFGEESPVNLLGRTKQFLLPLSASLYAAGWIADSQDLRDAGIGCATSNLTTTLSRSAVSILLGRLRPHRGEGAFRVALLAGWGDWDMRSFPGGHAANAMTCTSYFAHRFDLGAAEPAMWALASGIGLARVPDEAHWLSDTFAGMAYGYAVGKGVARRQLGRVAEREAERSMQPSLRLGWTITFD